MKELLGIEISGFVWKTDESPLDQDQFLDELIEFVESKNYLFSGSTKPVDLNEDPEENVGSESVG